LSDAAADPRVVAALERQLEAWRKALERGARRVGWKIGLNVPEVQERLGLREPVIGHLTSETRLEPGASYSAGDAEALRAEPEIAVEVRREVPSDADEDAARDAIAGLAPAIELVDVGRPPGGLEAIVAENVFHRAFVVGDSRPAMPAEGVTATVMVNGEERESADAVDDLAEVVRLVARLLGAVGERLEAGDRIISGSLTPPVPVEAGERVAVHLSGLGQVEAQIAP
jgi:2-keto-4-pentenoate hydratase